MTLTPPLMLEPGTCGCTVDGDTCACMPADAGELLTSLSEAKYRLDAATTDGERAHWAAERTRISKQLNEGMTYRADAGARKDAMTTRTDTSPLTAERREEMITELSKLRLDAGDDVGEIRAQEQRLRESSDAYFHAYIEGATKSARWKIDYDRRKRTDAAIKEITQVTEADRQQAIADLEALADDARFRARHASPHAARTDSTEEERIMAIDMRSREIAKRRVAREAADMQMRAAPRQPATERTDAEPSNPYAPGLAADPAWTKKGKR